MKPTLEHWNQWALRAGASQLGMHTLVGLKLAMTSLTAEVVLTLFPRVLVMFNWGASAGAGDDSASISMGVADMVV